MWQRNRRVESSFLTSVDCHSGVTIRSRPFCIPQRDDAPARTADAFCFFPPSCGVRRVTRRGRRGTQAGVAHIARSLLSGRRMAPHVTRGARPATLH